MLSQELSCHILETVWLLEEEGCQETANALQYAFAKEIRVWQFSDLEGGDI